MNLLLLRHAHAVDEAATDRARPLSARGQRQARDVAAHLMCYPTRPEIVLTSPAVRTSETANVVANALSLDIIPCDWALPGMGPEVALDALKDFKKFSCILLVGHQPDLSLLTAHLLGLPDSNRLRLCKATMVHLSVQSFHSATLEAFIPCKRH